MKKKEKGKAFSDRLGGSSPEVVLLFESAPHSPGGLHTSCFRSGSPGWISPHYLQVSYSRAPRQEALGMFNGLPPPLTPSVFRRRLPRGGEGAEVGGRRPSRAGPRTGADSPCQGIDPVRTKYNSSPQNTRRFESENWSFGGTTDVLNSSCREGNRSIKLQHRIHKGEKATPPVDVTGDGYGMLGRPKISIELGFFVIGFIGGKLGFANRNTKEIGTSIINKSEHQEPIPGTCFIGFRTWNLEGPRNRQKQIISSPGGFFGMSALCRFEASPPVGPHRVGSNPEPSSWVSGAPLVGSASDQQVLGVTASLEVSDCIGKDIFIWGQPNHCGLYIYTYIYILYIYILPISSYGFQEPFSIVLLCQRWFLASASTCHTFRAG